MANFIQGFGQLGAGKSAQEQAEANAQIDLNDAAVVHEETKARTLDSFRQGRSVASQVRAQTAASGFAQEGTPLLLQAEAIKQAELNSLEEQRIGLTEEGRLKQSAVLNIKRGKSARRASQINALGSFVQGGMSGGFSSGSSKTSQKKSASQRTGQTDLPNYGGYYA